MGNGVAVKSLEASDSIGLFNQSVVVEKPIRSSGKVGVTYGSSVVDAAGSWELLRTNVGRIEPANQLGVACQQANE